MTEATMPIDQRLGHHDAQHLAAVRAERAQQRELARPLRDRDREGVEDDERADEHARSTPNASSAGVRKLPIASLTSPAWSVASLTRRSSPRRGGQRRPRARGRAISLGRDARLRGDTDLAELARLAEPVLVRRQGRDARMLAPPSRRVAELGDPDDRARVQPAVAVATWTSWPTFRCSVGDALVDREIGLRAAARREAPLDEFADWKRGRRREDRSERRAPSASRSCR